jgi:hypothetical protein
MLINNPVSVVPEVKAISQHYEQRMGCRMVTLFESKRIFREHALRLEAQNGKSGLREPSLAERT